MAPGSVLFFFSRRSLSCPGSRPTHPNALRHRGGPARLAAADLRPLEEFRQPHHVLRLGAMNCNAPPEISHWVEHVIYDDGYETPVEFGDPSVDWNESDEDIRDVSKLWVLPR